MRLNGYARTIVISIAGLLCVVVTTIFLQQKFMLQPLPLPWSLVGNDPFDYQAGIDQQIALSKRGAMTIRYLGSDSNDGVFGSIVQEFSAKDYAGKRVRFSAMVKVKDVKFWSGLSVRAATPTVWAAALDNMSRRPISGTKDWASYEVVIDIPSDAIIMTVGCIIWGTSGQVWVDEMSFTVVGSEVPVTMKTNPALHRKRLDLPSIPVL